MEFNEKLQMLRADKNMTQEELAKELYVSRTAISKWESGRGYPNIDSLKAIAKYFHVTIDELIGTEEIITLAEQDIKNADKKHTALICGILDCLNTLLLLLPLFGDSNTTEVLSVSVFGLTGVSTWLKMIFIIMIGLSALNGFCAVIISNFEKPLWNRHRLITGLALSIAGTVLFMLTRQPYAGIFYLCFLMIKGVLILKSK
jgi:transcriptional regulator with XRE-family HTH domain